MKKRFSDIIEVQVNDECTKYTVKYATGNTRTYNSKPSWFDWYADNSWSLIQDGFTVWAYSSTYIKATYKPLEMPWHTTNENPVELSTPEEVEEASTPADPEVQEITSADTSINSESIPVVFSTLAEKANKLNITLENSVVFDTGCGKYPEIISNFFKASNTDYIGRDKFNQPENVNSQWADNCKAAGSLGLNRIFTSSNVMNVIKGEKFRIDYLRDIMQYMKKGEKLYVTVYDGDRSGVGRVTKTDKNGSAACWQENKKYKEYIPECIKAGFTSVTPKYNMLICEL